MESTNNKKAIKVKHLRIKVVIFILAVICAISGIGYGIYALIRSGKTEVGWQNITITAKSQYHNYDSNVCLRYYVDESGGKTATQNLNQTRLTLNDSAGLVYSFLDADYDDYTNIGIGYINSHPNEKIEVNETVYQVLEDALSKTTQENSHYSVFNGVLNYFWFDVMSEDYYNLDPLYDDDRKIEFDDIMSISSLENYSLKLEQNEQKYYVTFSYSDQVKEVMNTYGYFCPVLDLNTLFYSYYLDLLSEKLIEKGYLKGYLYAYTGEQVYLSNTFTSSNDILIYDYQKDSIVRPGYLSIQGKCIASQIKSFPVTEYEKQNVYHTFIKNNQRITHSMYFDAKTGYSSTTLRTSLLVSTESENKLFDLTYENLNAIFSFSTEQNPYFKIKNAHIAYIMDVNPGNIYLDDLTETIYQNNQENYGIIIL